VNRRNGYRDRPFDTRVGSIELRIPKLRSGSYFPDWLLERRKRAETALTTVVATCYLLGVSTRRLERLAEALGITRLSKSQVSKMAKELDGLVESFRTRPLDQGPYRFVWADALVVKVREGGRTVGVHVLIATGVNAEGRREILGAEVTSAEDGAGWLAFFRSLVARGLCGVRLVTSDAHPGLGGDQGESSRGLLAAVPDPLPAGSAHQGRQVIPALGGHLGQDHRRPARRHRSPSPVRTGGEGPLSEAARGGSAPRRGERGPPRLLVLPPGDLAPDL